MTVNRSKLTHTHTQHINSLSTQNQNPPQKKKQSFHRQSVLERERAMEGLRRATIMAVLVLAVLMCAEEVSGTRWTVGGNKGWTTNVNYTIWAQDKHFYNGDWLCKSFLWAQIHSIIKLKLSVALKGSCFYFIF